MKKILEVNNLSKTYHTINEEINAQVYSKKEWNDYHYTPFYKNDEHDKIVLV